MLAVLDVSSPALARNWASAEWFRRRQLAPTFADSELTPLDKFYVNTYDVDDPEVDLEKWTLTVSGDVKRPGEYTLAQIQSLPKLIQNTRHICVEGWSAIGKWTGTPLREFLRRVGADTRAKYVWFRCADTYSTSIDMATALHPQTQITFRFAGDILPRKYGFPMKVRIPTKLGFKNPKHVMELAVTDKYLGGYWEDQGYNWFSGV